MKKVVNITLSGIIFACESAAYDALAAYLESVERTFGESNDYTEIARDIEAAIAEKFTQNGKNERLAVTHADVDRVIAEMGNVAEMDGGSGLAEKNAGKKKSGQKRLMRSTDDVILGGVASGIAAYFDIDPVIVRILFFASIFLNGLGIVVYILLWIIVPEAETTADRYTMRGERMTVSHITENVKKRVGEIDTAKLGQSAKNTWGGLRPLIVRFFELLGTAVRFIFHMLRYLIGIVLVVLGVLAVAGIVASTIVVTTGRNLFSFDPLAQTLISQIFTSSIDGLLLLMSSALVLSIPLIVLIIAGASLIRGKNAFTVSNSATLFLVWMLSIVMLSFVAATYTPGQRGGSVLDDLGINTACTLDAKVCPDGTIVGRMGPDCEFAACPMPHTSEKDDLIKVTAPLAGETITSPFEIRGQARGTWFFEATFPITVVNWDGLIIGEGYATAEDEWMTEDYVPFTGTVEFNFDEDTPYRRGATIFKKSNPSGLPEHDNALEVPVVF